MGQKLKVLKVVSGFGEIGLRDLSPDLCRTPAASSMCLMRLWRQRLLCRERVAGKIRYSLSRRGRERLNYLQKREVFED